MPCVKLKKLSVEDRFGLILPKKGSQSVLQKPSPFNIDYDSSGSDAGGSDWIKKAYQKESGKTVQKKQTKLDIQRALEQDSTIFQYDEIYDKIEQNKKQDASKKQEKGRAPRYIQSLLKTAQKRKLENERRTERQVHKEREAEGEEFKDKETFVTSSYRQKLLEFAEMDEKEKRQEMLEEIGDVTKQQDLNGFYRHLYQTTVSGETNKVAIEDKKLVADKIADQISTPADKARLAGHPVKKERQYRKHEKFRSNSTDENQDADLNNSSSSSSSSSYTSSSSESSEGEIKDTKSRFSKTAKTRKLSPSGEDDVKKYDADIRQKKNEKHVSKEIKKGTFKPVAIEILSDPGKEERSERTEKEEGSEKPEMKERHEKNADSKSTKKSCETVVPEPKINIWEKRTVGPVFEAALKKYYERKAVRVGS